jgi:hypothetical protein
MNCNRAKTAGFLLTLLFFFLIAATPAFTIVLVSDYKTPLKEKDRILGSMKENYLVYGRPNITMYSNTGQAVFSRKLKNNVKPTLSPNGKYLGLTTYADHSPTELRTLKFEMFDKVGNYRWKLVEPAANAFIIADNGAFFGIEGVEGIPPTKIHVYDQYGDVVNILDIKNYHGLLVSPSGGKFIIDRARAGLQVYDSMGVLLDSLPVSKDYVFDKDDRYIGTFFQGIFRLFQDGKEVTTIKSSEMVIREMEINIEKNLVVLMAGKRLEVYELTTKKLLWEYRFIEESKWFTDLDVSDDGRFIACGVDINGGTMVPKGKRHVEGYLFLFPISGKSLIREKETYELWASGLPRGVFSPSSGSVILQTREKLEKFRIRPGGN